MHWSRRKLITSLGLGVSLSGCLLSEPRPEHEYKISTSVVESPDSQVSLSVSEKPDFATSTRPAGIVTEYRNIGDELVTLRLNPSRPKPIRSQGSASSGIVLVAPSFDLQQVKNGCWKPEADSITVTLGRPQYELPSGEVVNTKYNVWESEKSSSTCLEPGEYKFELPEESLIRVSVERK